MSLEFLSGTSVAGQPAACKIGQRVMIFPLPD